MRIALVHDWLTGMRGGEKCLEVFCEIFPDADVYTLVYVPNLVSPLLRSMKVRASWLNRLPRIRQYYRYALPFFPRAIEGFDFDGYDLILSSSHCVAKGIDPQRALHIAYVHTPMRYIWDQGDAYLAGGVSLAGRMGLALSRAYLRRWDVRSAHRVDKMVAISRHVAGRIERIYGREAEVVYPPVDLERFYLSEARRPYFLIVSALVPYKRIDLAVEAFNELKLPLKIAGTGPAGRVLQRRAKSNIEFLGWVDDTKLADLYAQCQALIFPGEEDFGIVPLEAQASGRPVIAYGTGGVRETVIGFDGVDGAAAEPPTGIFFSEPTAASLIEAVKRYQAVKDEFDPAALRRHAEQFSRPRFKSEMQRLISASLCNRSISPPDVTSS